MYLSETAKIQYVLVTWCRQKYSVVERKDFQKYLKL